MASKARLDDAINEYLRALKGRGRAKSTITGAKGALVSFMTAVGNIYPQNINASHVDKWMAEHPEWANSTRALYLSHVSAFQNWMLDRGIIRRTFIDNMKRPKARKKVPQFVPPDQFDDLLDSAEKPRDRILLAMGLFLLIRESEMVTIKWGDIQDYVKVFRTKTGDVDFLPICDDLTDELERWRRHVCVSQGVTQVSPQWYVVCRMERSYVRDSLGRVGASGAPLLTPDKPLLHPYYHAKDLLKQIGVDERGTGMHTLRRSGAQAWLEHLMEQGTNQDSALLTVSTMLGHATVEQTMTYLNMTVNRARRDAVISNSRLIKRTPAADNVVPLKRGS